MTLKDFESIKDQINMESATACADIISRIYQGTRCFGTTIHLKTATLTCINERYQSFLDEPYMLQCHVSCD